MLSCAASVLAQNLPFHPYRKVGDKYYNLNPLYSWINSVKQRENNRQEIPTQEIINRPMKDWFGVVEPLEGIKIQHKVAQVLDDGLLVRESRFNLHSLDTTVADNLFFLKNYPDCKNLTDNQAIRFLALPTGNYKYTDTQGANRTVRCYDYGVPYDPWALQATAKAKEFTNSTVSTNSPTVKP